MPNLGVFKHGVSWSDVPTSVISPIQSIPGVNVVFGSAPLHLTKAGQNCINVPRIYNTYEDAVAELGFSNDWDTYDICEHMDSAFVEFGVYPVIYVAVNDPTDGATTLAPLTLTLVNGQVDSLKEMIMWTVAVTGPTGTPTYVEGVDYILSLSANNTVVITRIAGGAIPSATSQIKLSGQLPSTVAITAADIIGGVDITTGKRSGLEVIEDVFQKTGLVPGVLVAPKWSHDPTVASVMNAKCESINGCFAARCLIDVDTNTVKTAQDVLAWKNANNIVFPRQELLFGLPALLSTALSPSGVALVKKPSIGTADAGGVDTSGPQVPPTPGGDDGGGSTGTPPPPPAPTPHSAVGSDSTGKVFHFASQQGPLLQWTDINKGNGLPYWSPSNQNLRMNALLLDDGSELPMHLLDANMLNGQGVVTALNFIGGWRSWGNRTAAFPANTDVKDMFIPVGRMFDFIGNTIVLTIWQKVDQPGNRRLIDSIINSLQLWLDGLSNSEALLGAKLQFRQDENPTTELLNGHYVFHVYFAVPTPAEWLEFRLEYFIPFVQNLFPQEAAA